MPMENVNKGMLIIISGPSGSGKGTVVKNLSPERNFALSISMTTRKPRGEEVNGRDYFFTTVEEFETCRAEGGLLEHAVFAGNHYGTPRSYVEEQIGKGKFVILEIEVMGALQVADKFKDCVLIFLMPPSKEELARRLINRRTESWETIEERLRIADEEIKLIDKYNYLVINDEVSGAVAKIETIVQAECLKPHRNTEEIMHFKGEVN